ncbi:MAG: hypothetical protein NTW87_18210 [Planctomycetota bacterium]|nr:hypothetical protein [Planctomycetota bacterium]
MSGYRNRLLVGAATLVLSAWWGGAGEGAAALQASAAVVVAPEAGGGRRVQRQPACAFGKTVYLVAWCDGTRQADQPGADIYCARIEAASGKTLDPGGILWQDLRGGKDYDIYAARVGEDGKVLDPDGFPVVKRPSNQARPAVGFGGGNYLVAWMDARQYPVYGLYCARVSPEGKVLDAEGKALDVEDPARIAKVAPAERSWLGDKHYWWQSLSSRFDPAVASNGKTCLVTCLREVHSNQTTGYALLVDPAECSVKGAVVKLPGEPRGRVAACAMPDGWAVAFDHWVSGWSPTPRMAALRLEESLRLHDDIPPRRDERNPPPPRAPLMDLQKLLANGGGDYQQGKGHFAFWQAAAAWNGRHLLVVMDYGWRTKNKVNELNYAVVASRVDPEAPRFLDDPPLVVASGNMPSGTTVRHPVLAAGPDGAVLVVYELDAGVDKLGIEARVVR